jgi:hypothetical protein
LRDNQIRTCFTAGCVCTVAKTAVSGEKLFAVFNHGRLSARTSRIGRISTAASTTTSPSGRICTTSTLLIGTLRAACRSLWPKYHATKKHYCQRNRRPSNSQTLPPKEHTADQFSTNQLLRPDSCNSRVLPQSNRPRQQPSLARSRNASFQPRLHKKKSFCNRSRPRR